MAYVLLSVIGLIALVHKLFRLPYNVLPIVNCNNFA